ncbi:hypothetical protein JQS43_00215 [Natronosporangium hydrolyticum]|uniref:Uncharacterized protein n=1 Tax=Natronosporangium hydrolyticum TaxID=2811111 RepID=A0A895YSD8_9ACTN|nr:hypothetical protein JQS43_00215 [Natronosporangium hydrolyticum]
MTPSGLFPGAPPRRAYREPHPVRSWAVLAGIGAAGAWLVLFTLLGTDLPSHIWWLLTGGGLAWAGALGLARFGDRGVAVGVAVATAFAWATGAGIVTLYWIVTADWPLW